MTRPSPARYRTTNWSSYDAALKRRGSLLVWLDKDMTWLAPYEGHLGRPPVFSDAAVQFCLSIKILFKLPLRQTAGMVASLLRITGMDWPVPDYSTLCRRQKTLAVQIPYRHADGPPESARPLSGIADAIPCRAVDSPILPDLLGQIPEDEQIGSVTADGACDTRRCHTAIIDRGAAAIVAIRKNGRPWKEDCPAARARNETLRASRHFGRAFRKRRTGYHARSRIEPNPLVVCRQTPAGQWMRCLKAFGERIARHETPTARPSKSTSASHS